MATIGNTGTPNITVSKGIISADGEQIGTANMFYKHGYHPMVEVIVYNKRLGEFEMDTTDLKNKIITLVTRSLNSSPEEIYAEDQIARLESILSNTEGYNESQIKSFKRELEFYKRTLSDLKKKHKVNESPIGSTEPLSIGDHVIIRDPNKSTYGIKGTVRRIEDDQYWVGGSNIITQPYTRSTLQLVAQSITEGSIAQAPLPKEVIDTVKLVYKTLRDSSTSTLRAKKSMLVIKFTRSLSSNQIKFIKDTFDTANISYKIKRTKNTYVGGTYENTLVWIPYDQNNTSLSNEA